MTTAARSAHRTLRDVVADRYARARRWQREGGLVVGYVGDDAPLELVDAVGALPVRLVARPEADVRAASRYLSGAVDPGAVAVLADLLDGVIVPDLVLVTHENDAALQLFYTLRELARTGLGPTGSKCELVDVLHQPRRTTTEYVTRQLEHLRSLLESMAGRRTTPADLVAAATARQEVAAEFAIVEERQRTAALAGTVALRYRLAASALPPKEAIELLRPVRGEAVEPGRGKPLLMTGSGHDTPAVYDRLADLGWNVVADDHHRPRTRGTAAPAEPPATLAALALACQTRRGGPHTRPVADRVADLAAAARESAAAAHLAYVRRGDDGLRWDVPAIAAALPVPTGFVRDQALGGLCLTDSARTLLGAADG
ncbi:hypothetical protein GCM10010182_70540 [Actinomadura cremea]|nr:hypothetical protein GCM10010182_70540 [Actinomadura cremea]